MSAVIILFPYLLFGAEELPEQDMKAKIVEVWAQRYREIQTMEYVLEGTEVVTPDAVAGLADVEKSLVVKQRPINLVCRVDFPNRRMYIHYDLYEYQVHLAKFVRINRQEIYDEPNNRFDSYTTFFDSEMIPRHSSGAPNSARIGRSIVLEPIWFSSGIISLFDQTATPLTLPDYKREAQMRWTVASQSESNHANIASIVARDSERSDVYQLRLDTNTGFLPRQYIASRKGVPGIEINISYKSHGAFHVADKWEATVFSPKGLIVRCVSLATKSCEINRPFGEGAFDLQSTNH